MHRGELFAVFNADSQEERRRAQKLVLVFGDIVREEGLHRSVWVFVEKSQG